MDKEGEERIVRILNESFGKGRNPSVTTLGGRIVHFDSKMMDFAMIFIGKDEFCNGKPKTDGVQGGFAAAMLDSVCANAIVAQTGIKYTVATLEQKCTYIKKVPVGELYAACNIVKLGKQVAMLEATLKEKDDKGDVLVRASQTVLLLPLPPPPTKPKM